MRRSRSCRFCHRPFETTVDRKAHIVRDHPKEAVRLYGSLPAGPIEAIIRRARG